ncbi:alpha/beta hydrolase [Kitasatospora viridis]|uniref:Alpha/beta hydrolase family protein n=1 Tax=Kitasatospora viridis TaxID=281105 RepID=A0A561UKD4_9ACTN|nr:alpha/beta hydrolase [Kitasatospora viridis]TWF99824.1 alpha/beta hydrolase family protein [Kitasatospora viridis]
MDLASLRDADFTGLYATADAYDKLWTAFADHTTDWYKGTDQAAHGGGWTGTTADTALSAVATTTNQLNAAEIELGLIGGQLRESADAFQLAQSKLLKALSDAQTQHLTVDATGAVSWSAPDQAQTPDDAATWDAQQKPLATALAGRISAAISEAATADASLTSMLATYTQRATSGAGLDLTTANADQYVANFGGATPDFMSGVPGDKATPAEVKAWWDGLTPNEQQWFMTEHPDLIGNRDGIPADIRDKVNRAYLDKTLNDLASKKKPLSPADQDTYDKLAPIAARLDQDSKIQDGRPHDYLLLIGTDGQGRAAISFGNPDTATDISAYVPGMTTDPASLGPGYGVTDGSNEAENALNTWRAAQAKEPPGRSAASIVWLGYDPPPMPGFPDTNPSDYGAVSKGRAEAGAPAFAQFVTGLRATNTTGQPPHVTSIGHSYGSLLVGDATKLSTRPGAPYSPPDDVVLIGSPGVGVNHASDLGVPGHVWDGAARNDPITYLPSKTNLVTSAAGFVVDPSERWFGEDPSSSAFGAHRFTVNNSSGSGLFGPHTKYLTPTLGGPSLDNITNIVTGHYDQVHLESGR